MSEAKQPHLNGAYYGPSIPSPKTYHRPGRGGGGGCNPFGCLFGCLCSLFIKIIFSIIITVGLAIFVFWLIFRPTPVKFHVTEATLSQFDLSTTNTTLQYNLALNMTIRNPNKHIGIYYDRLEARAFYEGQRFAVTSLDRFYQRTKTTNYLSFGFSGQNIVVLQDKRLSDYQSDKSSGTYGIDVKLYLRIRFKLRGVKTGKFKPKIKCDLKVPLGSSGTFETTKCGFDW